MHEKLSSDELTQLVLASLEAERTNDVKGGLALLHPSFTKTSMVKSGETLFPTIESDAIRHAVTAAYVIEGREFYVFNVAANEERQTVFVELAEREPRDSGAVLWPYVLVCTIEDGKILRTRHYGDPVLTKESLTVENIRGIIES